MNQFREVSIPVDQLELCFNRAYKEHKPGSWFEAAAMIQSWKKMKAEGLSQVTASTFRCTFCSAHEEDSTVPPCTFHPVRCYQMERDPLRKL